MNSIIKLQWPWPTSRPEDRSLHQPSQWPWHPQVMDQAAISGVSLLARVKINLNIIYLQIKYSHRKISRFILSGLFFHRETNIRSYVSFGQGQWSLSIFTWNLLMESRTRMTPPGVFSETFSSHLGNSSTSLIGSAVRAGGEFTFCINCQRMINNVALYWIMSI